MPRLHETRQAGSSPVTRLAALEGLRLLLLGLLLAPALLLGGCVSGGRGGSIPYGVKTFSAPDAPTPQQALGDDYRISPLDKIKVTVFQVPDLSGDFTVDLTGNVALPLVGNVRAAGLTPTELDQRITQTLAAKYLRDPDVSVGVTSTSTRVVTIDGAVRDPGVFPAQPQMTLIQAIALAHGTSEDANPRRVAVFRTIQGQRMAAAFDLTSIRRGEAEDPKIYSGDIVVVDGSQVKATWKNALQAIPLLALFNPIL